MTPYEIDILLWYYARVEDHPDTLRLPPIWPATLDRFITQGLLYAAAEPVDGATWVLTPRGRAYVEALQCVPLPESQWVTRWPADVS